MMWDLFVVLCVFFQHKSEVNLVYSRIFT